MASTKSQFQSHKELKFLSTFGIGGKACYFKEVSTIEEMQQVLKDCAVESLPFLVIGRGSNCLFDDRGFDGLVIHNKIHFCSYEGSLISVGAGYNFSLLGVQTSRKGLTGLEFASGIPGSVGGAIFMNAGAGGTETCDTLVEVSFVNEKGEFVPFKKGELEFSYRFSSFQKMKGAIVGAKFELKEFSGARKRQLELLEYRIETQPYKDKSCGCVFRNPEGGSAGALIERCGLKGLCVGDARVSNMHANFIINGGNATSKDVLELVRLVKERVRLQTGIELEMELRKIDYE